MKLAVISMSCFAVSAVAGVGFGGPAAAQLTPPHHVGVETATSESRELASLSAAAEIHGNPQASLALADQALIADDHNAWAYYDRGAALARMGQTDRAVEAFSAAERRFSPKDPWARSIAIYGRAHALDQAKRCPEAKAAFEEYATFVQGADPAAAAMARVYANECGVGPASFPVPAPAASAPASAPVPAPAAMTPAPPAAPPPAAAAPAAAQSTPVSTPAALPAPPASTVLSPSSIP
jgi:hypothetical protein